VPSCLPSRRHPGSAFALLLALGACGADEAPLKYDENAAPAAEAIPKAGVTFRCTPTRVYAGEGPIRCAEGQRVHLAGIAAREIDGRCRANQPCPDATPEAAKAALVRLVSGKAGAPPADATRYVEVSGSALSCISTGWAGGRRVGAWCVSPTSGDLSCAMVAGGTVLPWPAYWQDHRC
jgi:hypothetical protein